MSPRAAPAILLLLAALARAEEPHIGYLFPAGARAGAETDIVIGGQHLEKSTGLHLSGEGVTAEVTRWFKELTPQEINSLRNRREALEQNLEKAVGAEREKMAADLKVILATFQEQGWDETGKKRLKKFDPRRQLNPQIREQLTVRMRVAASAAPGPREVRVLTPDGLSNPMVLLVGGKEELREVEPNDREIPDGAPVLTDGAVLNGQIMPGDADRFRVPLQKGERVCFTVQARALVPYLADAVPGWFQAVLALYDPAGRQVVAYADDHLFDPDPVLVCQAPEAGDYRLEIRDAIHRGREDFVYRITRSPGPAGGTDPAPQPGDLEESEPNDTATAAPGLPAGRTAFGRIDRPGDCDLWRFTGHAGRPLVAEIHARRIGSPLDALLELRDAAGKRLAVQDDSPDRAEGLITHHADALLPFTPPADGEYLLVVRDVQQRGGADFAYRLEIRPAQPGFDLRTTPSAVNIAAGGRAVLTVHLLRRDGFAGPLNLALAGAPPDWRLEGAVIPAGADRVRCTLFLPRTAATGTVPLALEGKGNLVRPAEPADDMMQAFLYRHLVRAEQGLLHVTAPAKFALKVNGPAALETGEPLRVPAGGSVTLVLGNALGKKFWGTPVLELSEPPAGVTLADIKLRAEENRLEATLRVDPAAKPGPAGNLILQLYGNAARKNVLATAPALPFEIVPAAP